MVSTHVKNISKKFADSFGRQIFFRIFAENCLLVSLPNNVEANICHMLTTQRCVKQSDFICL